VPQRPSASASAQSRSQNTRPTDRPTHHTLSRPLWTTRSGPRHSLSHNPSLSATATASIFVFHPSTPAVRQAPTYLLFSSRTLSFLHSEPLIEWLRHGGDATLEATSRDPINHELNQHLDPIAIPRKKNFEMPPSRSPDALNGVLIGLLSSLGSAVLIGFIFVIIYFFKYTSSGRILLDRIGRPGEYDDEQAFAKEEAEALEVMDDMQRTEYLRAKGALHHF